MQQHSQLINDMNDYLTHLDSGQSKTYIIWSFDLYLYNSFYSTIGKGKESLFFNYEALSLSEAKLLDSLVTLVHAQFITMYEEDFSFLLQQNNYNVLGFNNDDGDC